MTWSCRIDKRQGDMAHGITFFMWERDAENVRGEFARRGKKFTLDGRGSLTLAVDQWKYGDELVAQIFTREDGVIKDRRADGYTRVQIYLGQADLATAEALEQIATVIRKRVK